MTKIFGAIEAGGTKFICATVDHQRNIIRQARIATTTPEETLGQVLEFFRAGEESIVSLGISSFGPLDLDPASKHYGHITETPKLAWRYCDLLTPLKRLGVPMAIDTDVNGSALGEHVAGAAVGINTFVYFTIGTGIGGGGMVEGRLLHGLSHPEMGHMCIPHDRSVDPFPGACPSHGDCFEGLAAGPAIEKRWGKKAEELPPEHPAWDLEARYIAMALANTIYILSPKMIILGGGVMEGQFLFPRIRAEVKKIIAGYISHPMLSDNIDSFIVPPGLGSRSGIIGSAALAERAADSCITAS
jgi:fructokinase